MPEYYMQHHVSSVDHYDLRLETPDGYLSWAVPRGLPTQDREVRLAVQTPTHNLDYMKEGIIHEGYGAGVVQCYDHGTFSWKDEPGTNGRYSFYLQSTRVMDGHYSLIPTETEKQYLLVKHSGQVRALPEDLSALTGRRLDQIGTIPFAPVRPKLLDSMPQDGFLCQRKYDGYRMLVMVDGHVYSEPGPSYSDLQVRDKTVRLFSANGIEWTDKYPHIKEQLEELDLPAGTLLDGELVSFKAENQDDFQALQNGAGNLVFVAFDIPSNPGLLGDRLSTLQKLVKPSANVVLAEALSSDVDPCTLGYEGVVLKQMDLRYIESRWFKVLCSQHQELIVLGYTQPKGAKRKSVGALIVGYWDQNQLHVAGKVGTGGQLDDLAPTLRSLAPAAPLKDIKGATWVEPSLVARIRFQGWTNSGNLRKPVFEGIRIDKNPDAVTLDVALTHPDKELFPGVSKLTLDEYYQRVAPLMLPKIVGKPLALYRCPQGVENECFWQRYAYASMPGLDTIKVDGGSCYTVTDARGLTSLVQLDTVEIHVLNTEKPSEVIIDIDPSADTPWAEVAKIALEVRTELMDLGFKPRVVDTGQDGLHIRAPLLEGDTIGFPALYKMAKLLCHRVANRDTSLRSVSTPGAVRIEPTRNVSGANTIAPYSTRANRDATIAVPRTWHQVAGAEKPPTLTVLSFLRSFKS